MPSVRAVPAVAVALLAGLLHGFRMNAAPLLVDAGTVAQLGLLLGVLAFLAALLSPFAAAVAGYLWGTDADVPASALAFVGGLVVAVAVGFGLAYVPTALLTVPGGGGIVDLLGKVVVDLAYSLVLLEVPLVALAGGAVAHYRRESGDAESGNSSTAPA